MRQELDSAVRDKDQHPGQVSHLSWWKHNYNESQHWCRTYWVSDTILNALYASAHLIFTITLQGKQLSQVYRWGSYSIETVCSIELVICSQSHITNSGGREPAGGRGWVKQQWKEGKASTHFLSKKACAQFSQVTSEWQDHFYLGHTVRTFHISTMNVC